MDRFPVTRRPVALISFLIVISGMLSPDTGGIPAAATGLDSDTASIAITTDTGLTRAKMTVYLAESSRERYIGLSRVESLSDTRGMLFVYPAEAPRTFVMRSMDFPLDMLFFGEEGHLNSIHHAVVPNESDRKIYRGPARWVLETNYNWTKRNNVTEGNRLILHGLASTDEE